MPGFPAFGPDIPRHGLEAQDGPDTLLAEPHEVLLRPGFHPFKEARRSGHRAASGSCGASRCEKPQKQEKSGSFAFHPATTPVNPLAEQGLVKHASSYSLFQRMHSGKNLPNARRVPNQGLLRPFGCPVFLWLDCIEGLDYNSAKYATINHFTLL